MDKVLIPMDLWYAIMETSECDELKQQCRRQGILLNDTDIEWIKGSLEDESERYPSAKIYLHELAKCINN